MTTPLMKSKTLDIIFRFANGRVKTLPYNGTSDTCVRRHTLHLGRRGAVPYINSCSVCGLFRARGLFFCGGRWNTG